jgi:hypothetical protein
MLSFPQILPEVFEYYKYFLSFLKFFSKFRWLCIPYSCSNTVYGLC